MVALTAAAVLEVAQGCHNLSNLWCPCPHPRQLPMAREEAVVVEVAVTEVVVVIAGKEAMTSSISEAVAMQPAAPGKQW